MKSFNTKLLLIAILNLILADILVGQAFFYSSTDLEEISKYDTVSNSQGTVVLINRSINIYFQKDSGYDSLITDIKFYPLKVQILLKNNAISALRIWGLERKVNDLAYKNTQIFQLRNSQIALDKLHSSNGMLKVQSLDKRKHIILNDFIDYIEKIEANETRIEDQSIILNLDETKTIDVAPIFSKNSPVTGFTINDYKKIITTDTTKSSIGTISLLNKCISVYGNEKRNNLTTKKAENTIPCIYGTSFKTFRPISAFLYFSDGLLSEIRVYLEVKDIEDKNYKQIYYFQKSGLSQPIQEINRNENKMYKQIGDDCENKGIKVPSTVNFEEYICTGDFLSYFKKLGVNKSYPDDGLFIIDRDRDKPRSSKPILVNEDLNLLIQVDAYSDLLATTGEESNGIVQLEPSIRIPISREPIHTFNGGKRFYIFNSLKFNGIVRRFDKSENFIKAELDTSSTDTFMVNRLDVLQRSLITTGLDLSLIRFTTKAFDIDLEVGFKFNFADTKIDSSKENGIQDFENTPSKSLNSVSTSANIFFRFYKSDNFGANIKVGTLSNGLLENNSDPIIRDKSAVGFWNAGFQLFYITPQNNRVFFRAENSRRINDAKNDFLQLQFGFSTNLNFKGL